MSFHEQLERETAVARQELSSLPMVADILAGRITVALYIDFLTQAYHHVRHSVPLMMACGARLDDEHEWLRARLVQYLEEDYGLHEWILQDIAACGGDREMVSRSRPAIPTEIMIAYAYDTVNRGNPVGLFGMVHVLEGVRIALASRAAGAIAGALRLPKKAFHYLGSRDSLDVDPLDFFRDLVDRFERSEDRITVVHASRVFARLYGDVFRHLHQQGDTCATRVRESAPT